MAHGKRNQQVLRQWRILLALDHREWFSIRELHDCLPDPPHKRTIFRDLEGLRELFPIERRVWSGTTGYELQYRLRKPLTEYLRRKKS
jgi:hypothetical protein